MALLLGQFFKLCIYSPTSNNLIGIRNLTIFLKAFWAAGAADITEEWRVGTPPSEAAVC